MSTNSTILPPIDAAWSAMQVERLAVALGSAADAAERLMRIEELMGDDVVYDPITNLIRAASKIPLGNRSDADRLEASNAQ